MTLELEGKILTKLPLQSGQGARGPWARQDFVIEYPDGNFTAEACLSVWGQDKVNDLAAFKEGDAVKVSFNVKAREFNGRWYNDLRVWKISAAGAQGQAQPAAPAAPQYAPAPAPAASQYAPAPAPEAPAPTFEDYPGDSLDSEDLPF